MSTMNPNEMAVADGHMGKQDCPNYDPDAIHIPEKGEPFYDPRNDLPVDPDFVSGIIDHGILQPVKCIRKDGKLILIMGRQRVKGARVAKHQHGWQGGVPVLVTRTTEGEGLEKLVIENEHRIADDPITQAIKMQRMLDQIGDMNKVTRAFRLSAFTIKNQVKLLDLSTAVQEAVKSGKLAVTAALTLVGLPIEEQDKLLEGLLKDGAKPTAEMLRNEVAKTKGRTPKNGEEDEAEEDKAVKAPGGNMVRRMATALVNDSDIPVSEETRYLIRYLAGLVGERTAAKKVPGLTELIGAASSDRRGKAVRG